MDIRNLLGKLDQLSEGTMASAKKKPTGPKFTGKMKGTDPASAAKSKYVGGESILRDLEAKLNEEPEKRDLMKEFREFKEQASKQDAWAAGYQAFHDDVTKCPYAPGSEEANQWNLGWESAQARGWNKEGVAEAKAATASFRSGNNKRAALNAMSDEERRAYDKAQQEKQRKRDDARLERERQKLAAKKGVAEGIGQNLSVQQLATISDEALDKAYGYGRSTPGNSFGWQANLMSAAYAKKMIDAGVTDIEKISDAIHKGWNVTAQKFVQDPDQFGDTEKLRQAGKLEAKLQQRAKLMKINYAQLDNEEQEKDRVVARALLQAIKGQQGVGEGLNEFAPAGGGGNIPRGPKTPKRDPWGDNGEDPYQLRRYNRSADFFDQFDSDGVDKQNFDKATGEYEGYYFDRDAASGITQIAYFKFDDPTKIGDNDSGAGWYHEPVDESIAEGFSDLELAVMEGGHELIKENPVAPAAPAQPGKPTLGTDLSKPAGQQDAQQQQQDQKAQQLAAQKEKQEQATLTKGVNALKSAGAAVSNPNQVVKAFDKAEDNQGLTPADKNSIASAGTVLAPIMANPQLQGKFKDLVAQASAAQKKEQQKAAQAPNATGGAAGSTPQPAAPGAAPAPAPAGQVK
jgi:hypothetical protein